MKKHTLSDLYRTHTRMCTFRKVRCTAGGGGLKELLARVGGCCGGRNCVAKLALIYFTVFELLGWNFIDFLN